MTDLEKKSYAMGVAIGSNYMGTTWDANAFANGFMHMTAQQPLLLSMEEIQHQKSIQKKKTAGLVVLVFVILVLVATAFLVGLRWQGPHIAPTDAVPSAGLCLMEEAKGLQKVHSEESRLFGYRDEGIEPYFVGETEESLDDCIEANLHTLIETLEKAGYNRVAVRRSQAVYLYYNLARIGWDYRTLHTGEVRQVKETVDAEGNFRFDEAYWRTVCAGYGA